MLLNYSEKWFTHDPLLWLGEGSKWRGPLARWWSTVLRRLCGFEQPKGVPRSILEGYVSFTFCFASNVWHDGIYLSSKSTFQTMKLYIHALMSSKTICLSRRRCSWLVANLQRSFMVTCFEVGSKLDMLDECFLPLVIMTDLISIILSRVENSYFYPHDSRKRNIYQNHRKGFQAKIFFNVLQFTI